MYAVIVTGGKQYRVEAEQQLTVERLEGDIGSEIILKDVLALGTGSSLKLGNPHVAGATVKGTIVEQSRGPHLIVFKKRRRQNSRRKNGHRQDLTVLKITQISA